MRWLLVAVALAMALVPAGCGYDHDDSESAPAATTSTAAAAECSPDNLQTVEAGKLTVGTDNPAFPPWFEGGSSGNAWELNDPASQQGFESAVAYAVSEVLGYSDLDVEWVVVPFAQSFRPGPKNFDFDINQISYTPERDKAVDFSESYYDVNQSVVAVKGTPIANAKTKADLKQYKLGAQIGTTSLEYITENIQPDQEPSVYDTNNDVVSALQAKQIDGAVVDLPTAFYMAGAQIDNGVIVGKFPALPNSRERFGMVFEQGSPLVRCVNQALDFLKARGTLNEIQEQWLGQKVNVLVLN